MPKRGTLFTRRTLLQSLGAAGIALPFFSSIGDLWGAPGTPSQKRFVYMFSANGTIPDAWIPSGNEDSPQYKSILQPLNAHKSKINVLQGLSMVLGGVGDGHQQGMGQMLTGSQLTPGSTKGGCQSCPAAGWAGGKSIDQHIADLLEQEATAAGRTVKYKSLEFGVQATTNNVWGRMCYRGKDKPITPMNDPYDTFKQIFAGVGKDQQNFRELQERRKSVLDAVVKELGALKQNLGQQDQLRLDQHLTGIREVERSVVNTQDLSSCKQPTLQQGVKLWDQKNYPAIGKLQMQLLTTAIICGVTQVATIQWSRSVSNVKFSWLNIAEGHHSISHKGDGDAKAKADLIAINKWYAEQYKFLLDELSKATDTNGNSVLDNTVVLWGNELGKGNTHTRNNIPFVMAGNVDGYFKQGKRLTYPTKTPHNHLFISLAHAYGDTKRTSYNDGRFKGPLANIRA